MTQTTNHDTLIASNTNKHKQKERDMTHISTIKDKTAKNLSVANLDNDIYHANIKYAALGLVLQNKEYYVYRGQYSSGNTYWENLQTGNKVTMQSIQNDTDGVL